MKLITRLFSKKSIKTQCAGAIRYPDRILIETQNQVKDGFWVVADKITYISRNASDEEIEQIIIKHLNLSITEVAHPNKQTGFKEIQEQYKIATGLKTFKSQMQDAEYVSVCRENGKIRFSPSINGGTTGEGRGYKYKPNEDIEIEDSGNLDSIGKFLNLAWDKCE